MSTVERRIREYGLEEESEYSDISDTVLDSISSEFSRDHPNSGSRSFEEK